MNKNSASASRGRSWPADDRFENALTQKFDQVFHGYDSPEESIWVDDDDAEVTVVVAQAAFNASLRRADIDVETELNLTPVPADELATLIDARPPSERRPRSRRGSPPSGDPATTRLTSWAFSEASSAQLSRANRARRLSPLSRPPHRAGVASAAPTTAKKARVGNTLAKPPRPAEALRRGQMPTLRLAPPPASTRELNLMAAPPKLNGLMMDLVVLLTPIALGLGLGWLLSG